MDEDVRADGSRRCAGYSAGLLRAVTPAIEQHGGAVEKYIGDAVLAVFGVPQAHEDDPERAVRAALAMQEAIADLNDSLATSGSLTSDPLDPLPPHRHPHRSGGLRCGCDWRLRRHRRHRQSGQPPGERRPAGHGADQ